jgi:mannosyl-oligosaccharide alpha-1,2-mannosidase
MYMFGTVLVALEIASQVAAAPQRSHARYGIQYQTNETRANAVKEAFQTAWDGYVEYAYGHDSLRPVSNSYDDDR